MTFSYQLSRQQGIKITPRSPTQRARSLFWISVLQTQVSVLGLSLCRPLSFCEFSYSPRSILLQLLQRPKSKVAFSCANFKYTLISWLFFPVRCFIITNSNKGFFLLLKIFSGFCLPSVSSHVRGLYPRS